MDAACKDDQWKCDSGQCIPDIYYCDGYEHCGDGNDESSGCSELLNIFYLEERDCPNFHNLNPPKTVPYTAKTPLSY